MAFPVLGLQHKSQMNKMPLLMERSNKFNDNEHVIDITNSSDASSSSTSDEQRSNGLEQQRSEDQGSTSARVQVYQPSLFPASGSNSRNSPLIRRGNSRRRRSPLNSGLWISFLLVLTVIQIIAAIVVLSLSMHEHPHAPLKEWIVGYALGSVGILPLLYWRFRHRNQGSDQDTSHRRQDSSQNGYSAISSTRIVLEREDRWTTGTASRGSQNVGIPRSRFRALVEYFKMALDCFFAVWFVVGNVWVFGGHASSAEAPNLYRLCIVFLTLSCIGYAMPFILCAAICCCLPCLISILGIREDLIHYRGASQELINSLPTYKFKVKNKNSSDKECNPDADEGGIVAAGTQNERLISGEDAICCICLAKYLNNDDLRELPCSHLFHRECVDKWLKINASCPLCKAEVDEDHIESVN
ncbi:E3 ubiquitin- ligase At1g63170-like [Olea europaea subsp. europaea]|uniref:E3 ubiquitin- ligase At1g63170-like n=1 Tax=Olea europaea subsp. europaea TaxID=158383 RepID=A0A8S0T0C6_OLEEU|nr:E3 ubiquitin- ligase At1g63170-like [Olea europaea subsp. europaea]